MGQDNILRHAIPTLVQEAKLGLRHCISLICGQTKPVQGQLIIFRNPFPISINNPQVELRQCVPLDGGLLIPLPRLNIVLGDTLAVGI